ncbi:HAD-IIIA family hydrolase [bacterium]|nr:HAD-IIIA family hydrolase [bacterium]
MIQNKITTRETLQRLCGGLRKKGMRIGFTSGVFDIVHAGHVRYLEKAKDLCDMLIVGVNTDDSVRRYKGSDRPFVAEQQRMTVLAALEAVDYVFPFAERRNRKNIEILRPDLYIKAGDYRPESLTSKELVESLGGTVVLIPVEDDISTTAIIETIRKGSSRAGGASVEKDGAVHLTLPGRKAAPGLFLDRDGTINEEVSYLHDPAKFRLLPGVLEGVKRFQEMGYRIIVVTNQPGIGMGYFSEEDFYRVNREMLRRFSEAGILVDRVYFCPHTKADRCTCRKPEQGLIERAGRELDLIMEESVFVGDKTADIETGRRAGMKTVLVSTGYGGGDGEFAVQPAFHTGSIAEAADIILALERGDGGAA